jgi:hypothetical protein
MNTDIKFWTYLAHLFLEWEMFQTEAVENIKTQISCSVTFFFHIHTVHLDIIKGFLFTNWCTSELS